MKDSLRDKIKEVLRKPQGNFEGYSLIHNDTVVDLETFITQHTQEAVERARVDEARIIHNNLDHYFNIIERIQPGYDGDRTIEVRSLQKVLCEHRDTLTQTKGDK
jgi:flagellar biosynthesis component FlhA